MEGLDWIHLDQDRKEQQDLMKMVMHLWFPYNAGKFICS
jgi:hypothetical protein